MEELVTKIITDFYDLGTVKELKKCTAGTMNISYIVTCTKDGKDQKAFFKQYYAGRTEQEMRYEHVLIKHLSKKASGMIPKLYYAKDGKTYVEAEYNGQTYFHAVFSCLEGREPYGWRNNAMSDTAFEESCAMVARFHHWGEGFEAPEGMEVEAPDRYSEVMLEWKEKLPKLLDELEERGRARLIREFIRKKMDFILEKIEFCVPFVSRYLPLLPQTIIHNDINPQNMKYDEEDHVTAVFDLDWIGEDKRLIDIAYFAHQTLSSWDTDHFGEKPLDLHRRYLEIYNNTMRRLNSSLGVLTEEEKECYPYLLMIQEIWIVLDMVMYMYNYPDHNEYEYFLYTLKFYSSFIDTVNHFEEIQQMLRELK